MDLIRIQKNKKSIYSVRVIALMSLAFIASGCFSSEMEWGNALFSSSGDSTSSTSSGTTFSSDRTKVSAILDNICAIEDGYLSCAGDARTYQLGINYDGTNANTFEQCNGSTTTDLDCIYNPIEVSATKFDDRVLDIDSGKYGTCVIYYPDPTQRTKGVACWGSSGGVDTRLYGVNGNTVAPFENPTPVDIVFSGTAANLEFREISVGKFHACVLGYDSDSLTNQVWCWGWNGNGELGMDPGMTLRSDTPVQINIPSGYEVKSIHAGYEFNCVIASGTFNTAGELGVLCWGSNEKGQLGRPARSTVPWTCAVAGSYCEINPERVITSYTPSTTYMTDVSTMDVAVHRTCAVIGNPGQVSCWGDGNYEALGTGSNPFHTDNAHCGVLPSAPGTNFTCFPQSVTTRDNVAAINRLEDIVEISLSPHGGCALDYSGPGIGKNVHCWGENPFGFMSSGVINAVSACSSRYGSCLDGAEVVLSEITGDSFEGLEMAQEQICVINSDKPMCMGVNHRGQLGNGDGPRNLAHPYLQLSLFNFGN